jgi:hypothetical protein
MLPSLWTEGALSKPLSRKDGDPLALSQRNCPRSPARTSSKYCHLLREILVKLPTYHHPPHSHHPPHHHRSLLYLRPLHSHHPPHSHLPPHRHRSLHHHHPPHSHHPPHRHRSLHYLHLRQQLTPPPQIRSHTPQVNWNGGSRTPLRLHWSGLASPTKLRIATGRRCDCCSDGLQISTTTGHAPGTRR